MVVSILIQMAEGSTKGIYGHHMELLYIPRLITLHVMVLSEMFKHIHGCLRNYGNQFFHDVLSRGVAYRYLDWLLNVVEENKIESNQVEIGS